MEFKRLEGGMGTSGLLLLLVPSAKGMFPRAKMYYKKDTYLALDHLPTDPVVWRDDFYES